MLFQSTPSAWRETCRRKSLPIIWQFQSTPSAWRETNTMREKARNFGISIHSLRMEGDVTIPNTITSIGNFNPLPPHGGRRHYSTALESARDFNPLPPHGGRQPIVRTLSQAFTFQSTPSAWRETRTRSSFSFVQLYFNPLPPHGGRPYSA